MIVRAWKTRLAAFYRRAAGDPLRADIGLYAANGAYYLFLSLGPLTALLLSLLPYTAVTEQRLLDALSAVIPAAFGALVHAVAADVYAAPGAALGLSLAAELWSAAKLLTSVVRGVRELSGAPAPGYLRRRLLGAAYTLVLIAFILGNLMLLLFGERLEFAARRRLPALGALFPALLSLRPLILFGGLTAANALLFRCAPGHGRTLPGAAGAAAAFLIFTRLYSIVLERFGLFGVYGSIAAVLVTLYWAYCSLFILFSGAWLNRLLTNN